MPTAAPTFGQATSAATSGTTSTAFPGSGTDNNTTLGITAAQAAQTVIVNGASTTAPASNATNADQNIANAAPQIRTVGDQLAYVNSQIAADPAYATQLAQELYDAGLMTDTVYNSGQINNSDIYAAYKKAVLNAANAKTPLGDYIVGSQNTFQAQGGPKVKLPNVRYVATLTSQADVLQAGDTVFEQLLGRRMTPGEAAAIHGALNVAELSARTSEAQSEYSQLLGYRGLSPTGAPSNPFAPASAQSAAAGAPLTPATPGQPNTGLQGLPPAAQTAVTTPGTTPGTVGNANLPQQVTNAQGQTSTVSQAPTVTPYNQSPTPTAAAYQYAMTNDQSEISGRTVAAAMQAIAQFIGKP